MTGRCEICGKENAPLLCLYDLHICEGCTEKIARKLVDEGFVEFFSNENKNKYAPIEGIEIEARICVVKPIQEGADNK